MRKLSMLSARRWARVGASRAAAGSLFSLPPLHTRRTLACLSSRGLAPLAPPLVPRPLIISALRLYLSGPLSTSAPLSLSLSSLSGSLPLFLTSALPPTAPPSTALPWSPNARAHTRSARWSRDGRRAKRKELRAEARGGEGWGERGVAGSGARTAGSWPTRAWCETYFCPQWCN